VLRYEPEYYSKKGFYSPSRRRVKTMNVGDLEDLAMRLSAREDLEEREGLVYLDLDRLGYNKLLGMGRVQAFFNKDHILLRISRQES
jgi:ribosomal protein L15